jgi:outer membrane protein assembly factor BamB
MRLPAHFSVLIIAIAVASVARGGVSEFADPAPPRVLEDGGPAPEAGKNPGTTFHAAPKPLAAGAITSDWPSFLGPTHNAFSPETKLLAKFPTGGPAVVWEVAKGEGYASPAIVGDRLVLFHRVADKEVIDCLHPATGDRYWRFEYPTAYTDRYGYCNGPRSSPVIGGDYVYAVGAEGKLHCVNLRSGKLRWERDLAAEFHLEQNFFGVGASPLVEGNAVIVNVGAPHGPCVAAFDLRSGKMIWGAGNQWGPSYATPVPAVIHGKRRVLVFAGGESHPASGGLLCIDPADGHVDFEFPWRGHPRESVNASSPVALGNQIFISECYGSGGVLLDVAENMTASPVWTNENFGTHFMTAIPKDGYFYAIDGHGPLDAFFCCFEQKTGKEVWRTRPEWKESIKMRDGVVRSLSSGTDRCNLLMIDGRCLCLGEWGHLLWVDLNPKEYKQVQRTWLFQAGETWTPPVVSRGLLYVCQSAKGAEGEPMRLLCYDFRGNG